MPTRRELIMNEAMKMTKDIPGTDVLVPLQTEEKDLVPYPKSEYEVVMEMSLDKFRRKVNQMIGQGRMPTGGVNVVSNGTTTRFYQSMERRNVDGDEKPEMPSENSEAEHLGSQALHIPGLENEPDLYEDIGKDETEN